MRNMVLNIRKLIAILSFILVENVAYSEEEYRTYINEIEDLSLWPGTVESHIAYLVTNLPNSDLERITTHLKLLCSQIPDFDQYASYVFNDLKYANYKSIRGNSFDLFKRTNYSLVAEYNAGVGELYLYKHQNNQVQVVTIDIGNHWCSDDAP